MISRIGVLVVVLSWSAVGMLTGGAAAAQEAPPDKPTTQRREAAKRKVAKTEADKSQTPSKSSRNNTGPDRIPIKDVQSDLESGNAPAAATIERIMNQAVRNIAARYNLNQAQTEETHKIMHREVLRFIQEHESEVWPVIRDLLSAGLGTKPPSDPAESSRIGKAARPLQKLAKEATFRGNEEWRLILTPEQKKLHDFDLAEMEKTFQQIDKNLADWETGRVPEHGLFPPPPQLTGREPSRPSKPPEGLPDPAIEVFNPANVFEKLVEDFIKDYELSEGQITSARSILEEFKNKANDFRAAKKEEFAKIAAEQQEAASRRDLEGIKKASIEHKKLLQPIYDLCDAMEDRLKGLLTTAQVQRYEEKHKEGGADKAIREVQRSEPSPPVNQEPTPKPEAPAGQKPAPSGEASKSDSHE